MRALSRIWRRRAVRREIDEELRFHIERSTAENVAAGMTHEAASREARRRFGNLQSVREECREARGAAIGEALLQDLQYGMRGLANSPAFTAVAVLSLAFGIGATTTMFSLADAALFRPLPVRHADSLLTVHRADPAGSRLHAVSYPDYLDYRAAGVFEEILAWGEAPVGVQVDGPAQQAWSVVVSGNYFSLLGVEPALGRLLDAEDDRTPGAHPVVVLGFGFWQARFGGDPAVLDRTIAVNGHAFTIVGVAARGFTSTYGVFAPALYFPLSMQAEIRSSPDLFTTRLSSYLKLTGRLAPGVSREQGEAALTVLDRRLEADASSEEGAAQPTPGLELAPVGSFPGDIRLGAFGIAGLLLGIAGTVLLIACANVAGMLLARATVRRREMAVRLALGATRRRLIRQLLTESALLFCVAGALGAALAAACIRLAAALPLPAALPFALEPEMDWRVLAFTLLLSLGTGIVFGLAPALEAARADLHAAMKDAPAPRAIGRSRLRQAFVVAQIALASVLLIAAGIAARAVRHAGTLYPGREPETVLTAGLDPAVMGYGASRARELYRQLTERVAALPGVDSVSLVRELSLGGGYRSTVLVVEGLEGAGGELEFECNTIAPEYFRTVGIALLEGRDFAAADREGAPRVLIVNAALARRFWPDRSALGRRLGWGDGTWAEIVGVVQDGPPRLAGRAAAPFVYVPYLQSGYDDPNMTLVWRQRGAPLPALEAVGRELAVLDPDLPLLAPMTLAAAVRQATLPWRAAGALAAAFGLVGLSLALLGVYGVVSYTFAQRTHEIGVRVALGANRTDVFRLVIAQGAKLALVGAGLGAVAALGLTRALSALLFGMSAADLATCAGVALLLVTVALVACWVPARRAARIAPASALRHG